MQETFPISEQAVEELAKNAVTKVFDTMLEIQPTLTGSMSVENQTYHLSKVLPIKPSQLLITGTVGFVGDFAGIIYIFMEMPFAIKATCKLLDMEADEVEADDCETVNDAIGEITNMIVGSFKNELSEKGYECRMTIPSILRGSNYSIEPAAVAMRRVYKFECEGSALAIDILMKEEQ